MGLDYELIAKLHPALLRLARTHGFEVKSFETNERRTYSEENIFIELVPLEGFRILSVSDDEAETLLHNEENS